MSRSRPCANNYIGFARKFKQNRSSFQDLETLILFFYKIRYFVRLNRMFFLLIVRKMLIFIMEYLDSV